MNSQIDTLDNLVKSYIQYVFIQDEGKEKQDLDEYLEEDFKFKAVNDYVNGYDICDYIDTPICELLDFTSTCEAISYIQEYYEENYGKESMMDYKILTPEKVIRNYAYVFLYSMDAEELKELVLLAVKEREETDAVFDMFNRLAEEEEAGKPDLFAEIIASCQDSDEDSDEEDEEIPWCYADNKNAVCNCIQPCYPPSESDEDSDEEDEEDD